MKVSKFKKFLFILLFLFCTSSVMADMLTVFVGEIKIIEVGSIERVAVGNGKLLSTSILENGQLLLLAEDKGETTVHIWYTDGAESDLKVNILPSDANRIVMELSTLIQDIEGDIEVREIGEKIFLTGTRLDTPQNTEIFDRLLSKFEDIIDLTRKVPPDEPPLTLPNNKMVHMAVKITEFSTTKLRDLGIDWSDQIQGPSAGFALDIEDNRLFRPPNAAALTFGGGAMGFPVEFAGPLGAFGLITAIDSIIDIFERTGDAIVLAEPNLSARSGGSAEFLAGGEIPVVTSSGLSGTNVEFKEFGIKLLITPVVDSRNTIQARVETEISDADFANAVQGIPTFITRRTHTDINMKDGETLVMAGLIDRDISANLEKIPFLGDIPVIGMLFRSENWINDRSEMVIFVTPTVFDTTSDINKRSVNRRQEMFDQFKENANKHKILRQDLILDQY